MKQRFFSIWLLSLLCLPLLAGRYNTDSDLYGDWESWFYNSYKNGTYAEWPISGAGTQNNPYRIESEIHLACLAYWVNRKEWTGEGKYFTLTADLDMGYRRWIPIGVDKDHPFRGYFNGYSHTIRDITINVVTGDDSKSYYYGLFGYCEAIISDLNVSEVSININQDNHEFSTRWLCAGLLCGNLSFYRGTNLTIYGAIINCQASGAISGDIADTGTQSCLGGLVGFANNPVSIYHCHANLTSTLKGAFDVGGIVGRISGYNYNYLSYWKYLKDNSVSVPLETFIYDCTADVNLTVDKDNIDYYHVGGICGTSEGNIEGCASSGTIKVGTDGTAAGICGRNMGNIIACVSMVTATGGYNVGGIVGKNESRSMNGKTFYGEIHDCSFSGHLDGTNAIYCGGIAARSIGEYVTNSFFLGTIQASTSSKYTSPLQQRTDGETDYPEYCHYDTNLFDFHSDYLDYKNGGYGMTNYILTGGASQGLYDDEKVTSMKNVYYGLPSQDVTAVQWFWSDGFYPRLIINNDKSNNAEAGSLMDDVIKRALSVTGQSEGNFFRATRLFNYAWLTAVPACFTNGQNAYYVDNAITMTSKSGNSHTADYTLEGGQKVLTIEGTTATPAESGYVMLTIRDAATSLSKQMRLNIVYGNRQWDGTESTSYDGEGTEANPYLIHNARQFAGMIKYNETGAYYKLTQDIWFNDNLLSDTGTPNNGKYKWDRNANAEACKWKAHLNGDGHAVRGMWLDHAYGIFTALVDNASIENIAFVNTYVGTPAPTEGYLQTALFAKEVSGNAVIRNCLIDGVLGRQYDNMTTSGVFADLQDNGSSQYATIEDCVFAISGHYAVDASNKPAINFAFAPVAASSMGRIHRVLLLNNGEPTDGIGTTNPSAETFENSLLYYPTGYMDGYTSTESYYGGLSVAAMTNGTLFATNDKWVSKEGRFPMLKSFADTDEGKLLALPIYTAADNTLETLEQITDFEQGAAQWKMADATAINVVSELEIMEPLRADRTHLVRTLGEGKIVTPITVLSGFTPGIPFVDDHTKDFCVAAFDGNGDGKVNLTEVMGVNSSAFATAMAAQSTYTDQIQLFPELRYFKSVDDLNTVFRDKTSLKEVTLPAKIRTLDDDLFYGCSSLTSFTIPVSITSLAGSHPFNGSAIENFSTEKRHPTMETRSGVLMTKEGNQLVCYPNGRTGADIILSGIVERINSNAIYKVNGASNIYLDAPDYNCYTELAEGGITSSTGELMTIYVKDATNELTEDERSNALTGEGKGLLLEQFKDADCWSAYRLASKLKRYFELEVSTNSWDADKSCYWATMYIGFDTQLPAGLTAYIVDKTKTKNEDETIVLRKISNKVPMLTPVVIQATVAGKYKLYPLEEAKQPEIPMYLNLLDGTGRDGLTVNQSQAIDGGCLTLGRNKEGKVGFYIYKGTKKIPPYRAYLTVNKVQNSRLLEICDDEEITANDKVNRESANNDAWYTLEGLRIASDRQPTTKGVYIHNGKKVLIP